MLFKNTIGPRTGSHLACSILLCAVLAGASAQQTPEPYGLGCQQADPQAFARYPHCRIAAARGGDRPAEFSLKDDMPPVDSQGHTGSCVGWSTAYYCYSSTVARQRKLTTEQRQDPRFLFSPAYIWHQFNGGENRGMHIYEAFDLLAKQGCCSLAEMPWNEHDVTSQPDEKAKEKAAKYVARETVCLFKGANAGDAADPEKLRTWLWETKRPFVIAIPIYEEFFHVPSQDDFVYNLTDNHGKYYGNHAICILGYDENRHAFRMVNSWSARWGNNGYLWLSDEFLSKYAFEGWAQRPGGPIARYHGSDPLPITPHVSLEPAQKAR